MSTPVFFAPLNFAENFSRRARALLKGTHDVYQIKGLSETNPIMYHTCMQLCSIKSSTGSENQNLSIFAKYSKQPAGHERLMINIERGCVWGDKRVHTTMQITILNRIRQTRRFSDQYNSSFSENSTTLSYESWPLETNKVNDKHQERLCLGK